MLRCPEIRKHENPETIFNCFARFDEIIFSLQVLLPGFCKHTTMVCFVCSYSVCFVGEWYHFSTFQPAFCCFFVLLLFCKFHRMTRFKSISHSQRVTWNSASSTRLGRGILLRLQPRPSLQASKNTMNSSILVPWIPLGEILRIGFWHGCDFFGYRSDEWHHWSRQKEVVFVVHVAL